VVEEFLSPAVVPPSTSLRPDPAQATVTTAPATPSSVQPRNEPDDMSPPPGKSPRSRALDLELVNRGGRTTSVCADAGSVQRPAPVGTSARFLGLPRTSPTASWSSQPGESTCYFSSLATRLRVHASASVFLGGRGVRSPARVDVSHPLDAGPFSVSGYEPRTATETCSSAAAVALSIGQLFFNGYLV